MVTPPVGNRGKLEVRHVLHKTMLVPFGPFPRSHVRVRHGNMALVLPMNLLVMSDRPSSCGLVGELLGKAIVAPHLGGRQKRDQTQISRTKPVSTLQGPFWNVHDAFDNAMSIA